MQNNKIMYTKSLCMWNIQVPLDGLKETVFVGAAHCASTHPKHDWFDCSIATGPKSTPRFTGRERMERWNDLSTMILLLIYNDL